MAVDMLTKLRQRDKVCHYCQCQTNRVHNSRRQATKEHVVPRAFGGPNDMSNYVLACSKCNNERGTALWYCRCNFCTGLISAALDNPYNLRLMFEYIMRKNKPKIYKTSKGWATEIPNRPITYSPSWKMALSVYKEN